jgi:NADPH:quinone reductase-like Zn-dependent oxidoreductase
MRERAEKRVLEHAGPGKRDMDKTRARSDDDEGAFEGAEGLHGLERDLPSRALVVQEPRRGQPDPAAAQPTPGSTPARRDRGASVARRRPPEHVAGAGGQPSPTGPGEILVRLEACELNYGDDAVGSEAASQLSASGAPCMCGMDAAGTVISAGDRVIRFAVGDEVFGHFLTESWAWVETPCARTSADGPHIERLPEGLDPLAATAIAECGLTAKTILRAAAVGPSHCAVVVGATSRTGTVLVPLLAEAGAYVIAAATPEDDRYVRSLGAAETIEYTTANPVAGLLASLPDVDLFVDLVSFGEPYFITAGAPHGTIVTALPRAYEPGIPRIGIAAEPGDLAALAQHALDGPKPVEIAPPLAARTAGEASRPDRDPACAANARSRRVIGAAGMVQRQVVKMVRGHLLIV